MEDSIIKEENIPASNWFKFDVVGATIEGEVVRVFEKPGRDDFPPQRCFEIKKKDGSCWNVGIKMTSDYLMGRTNTVRAGDKLGFKFKAEIPPTKKGRHPAKSIEVYHVKVEKSAGEEKKDFGAF